MITVRYEIRVNDYTRTFAVVYFPAMASMEGWMFDQMIADMRESMHFPNGDDLSWRFTPEMGKPEYIIHEVRNDSGILFSDGQFTDGQKHIAKSVVRFAEDCAKRQMGAFQFIDNDEEENQ